MIGKKLFAVMGIVALASLVLACSAPAAESPSEEDTSSTSSALMRVFDESGESGECGQSCSVTCSNGSHCSASAPAGKSVCCSCIGDTPSCG